LCSNLTRSPYFFLLSRGSSLRTTLFPYTTLFRSSGLRHDRGRLLRPPLAACPSPGHCCAASVGRVPARPCRLGGAVLRRRARSRTPSARPHVEKRLWRRRKTTLRGGGRR